ncbi:MAG: glycoside hydrolase, partial [Bacilli bacterium]
KNSDDPMKMWGRGADIDAVLQLYITTKDKKYADRFLEKIWLLLEPPVGMRGTNMEFVASRGLNSALKALPYMDGVYKAKLKDYVIKYKKSIDETDNKNPYGVPIRLGGWGGSGGVVNFALTNYYAYKAFPNIMSKEYVFKGLNYIFGCHPYSNVSFVEAVGTQSKKLAYGNNRADFSTIAGGIVPGLILLKPDFLENKDDWPFLWGENEVTIGGSADYILLGCAVNEMIKDN